MMAAARDSADFERNPAAAEAAPRAVPLPTLRFFRKLSGGGLEEVVTEKRAREDESEERGDDGDGAGAAVEEGMAVERKRARVEARVKASVRSRTGRRMPSSARAAP